MNAHEVKTMLNDRIQSVCEHLLPGGKRKGHEWCCGSTGGEAGDSLKVSLNSGKPGVWADFAESKKGGVIDLWMEIRGVPFADALKEAKNWLGVTDVREERFQHPIRQQKAYKRPEIDVIGKMEVGGVVYDYLCKTRLLDPITVFQYQVGQMLGAKVGESVVFPCYEPEHQKAVELIKFLAVKRGEGGKKLIWASPDAKPRLFGWQAISKNAREIVITEGEIDCLTVASWGHPAVSLPSGVQNLDWIEHDFDTLERFEKIYICTDMDAPGHKCAEEIAQRLGRERCFRVLIPEYKDANEALLSGKFVGPDFEDCLERAKTLDPGQLRNLGDMGDDIWEAMHPSDRKMLGTKPPFDLDWRCRHGELSIWTGLSGHGKSHVLNQFLLHDAAQGEKICIASFEMMASKTGAKLVQMMLGCIPEKTQRERITPAVQILSERFWVIDHVGVMHYSKLLPMLAYAARRYGCTRFAVDSLLRCGVAEDDYNAQKEMVGDLVSFAATYGHVHLVCHSRKGEDESKAPGKLDVRGGASITDLCHNGFTIWRNKKKEQQIEEARQTSGFADPKTMQACDSQISMWKNRESGTEPYCKLWLHHTSAQFADRHGGKIFDYVSAARSPQPGRNLSKYESI